jgi:hypothetical protein
MTQTAPTAALGLRSWADDLGLEKTRAILATAGLSTVYFNAMANFTKTCTPSMYERIERAALAHGVTVLPDYEVCTRKSLRVAARAAKVAVKASQKDAEQRVIAEFKANREQLRA